MDEVTPSLPRGGSGVQETEPCGIEASAMLQPSQKVCVTLVAPASDHAL